MKRPMGCVKAEKRTKKKKHVFFEKEQFFRRLCQSYWELVYFETSASHAKFSVKSA
jgi:hypothetical protein